MSERTGERERERERERLSESTGERDVSHVQRCSQIFYEEESLGVHRWTHGIIGEVKTHFEHCVRLISVKLFNRKDRSKRTE